MVTENDCFRVLAANYGKHSTDRLGPSSDPHAIGLHSVMSWYVANSGSRTQKILSLKGVAMSLQARYLGIGCLQLINRSDFLLSSASLAVSSAHP